MDSDVFTPADAFSLLAPLPKDPSLFREGITLDLYVGEDRQMAGVIDRAAITVARDSDRLRVAGRDKGGYLVDSDTKALHFSHYRLKELAEAMLLPEWGIRKVVVSNEDNLKVLLGKQEKNRFKKGKPKTDLFGGTIRKETKIDAGQRIATVLDEHCRRAGMTWWITAQGDLYIGKPTYDRAPQFAFYLYAPGSANAVHNNIEACTVTYDINDRFSELVVVGQTGSDSSAAGNLFSPTTTKGKQAKKYRGSATDPDLKSRGITRKTIIYDNEAISNDQCKKRAEEEMQRRRLHGLVLNLTVPGFKQDGALYTVDTLAKVKIERLGIDDVFWIGQRRFIERVEKRRTEITLYQKGVYLP